MAKTKGNLVVDGKIQKPGEGPIIPAVAETLGARVPQMDDTGKLYPAMALPQGLLRPAAGIEELVESFKLYVTLKDRLLEGSDYTWHVKWAMGDRQERKVFTQEDEAKKFAAEIQTRAGISTVELEKKIKKSGCMKLSKAFTLSTVILDFFEDRPAGTAVYKVRAIAPNGQFRDRVGSCDRQEKGGKDRPFDHIAATANTRAEDRAIMALLGGENTSEEFPEHVEMERPVAAPAPETKPADPIAEIKDHFAGGVEPAKPVDERVQLNRRAWGGLAKLGYTKDKAKEVMKQRITALYKKESMKDLSLDEFRDLVQKIELAVAKKEKKA